MPIQTYRGKHVHVNERCLADTFVAVIHPNPLEKYQGAENTYRVEPLLVECLPFNALQRLRNIQAKIVPWEEYNITEGRVIEGDGAHFELPFEVAHCNGAGKVVPIEEHEKRHAIAAIAAI